MNAYELFQKGHDTLEISRILRIGEDEALMQLSRERSASRQLPDPYEVKVRNLSARAKIDPRVAARELLVRPNTHKPDWLSEVVEGRV